MKINCPYDDLEINIAALGLNNKLEVIDAMLNDPEFTVKFSAPASKADLNKDIANFQGISISELINSPNYNTLVEEYKNSEVHRLLEYLKSKGFSDKEAWAFLVLGLKHKE